MNWWKHIIAQVSPLAFRNEITGASRGQIDMILVAYNADKKPVGGIQYCIYNDEVYIQYINTRPEYRRQGVATALIKKLQEENIGMKINRGNMTDDGSGFFNSLDNL